MAFLREMVFLKEEEKSPPEVLSPKFGDLLIREHNHDLFFILGVYKLLNEQSCWYRVEVWDFERSRLDAFSGLILNSKGQLAWPDKFLSLKERTGEQVFTETGFQHIEGNILDRNLNSAKVSPRKRKP